MYRILMQVPITLPATRGQAEWRGQARGACGPTIHPRKKKCALGVPAITLSYSKSGCASAAGTSQLARSTNSESRRRPSASE